MTSKTKNRANDIKVAVVCEPLYKKGGAETHLQYILEAFPNSEIFTAYYDEQFVKDNFQDTKIHSSFMQHLPKKDKFRNPYLVFNPYAYKSFNFDGFDIVISLSIAFARFVKPANIKHINICMSPPKFLWQKEGRTIKTNNQLDKTNKKFYKIYDSWIGKKLENKWEKEDKESARNCYKIIAISETVKKRIKKYYEVDSDVIYPPVEVTKIEQRKIKTKKENWFLYLGRIETYKGVELAIRACVELGEPLKVAGTGQQLDQMQELVKNLNAKGLIKFLGFISDDQKFNLLAKTKGLIFPVKDEDFGIVPVEANASGTPVIAYREGGVTETISEKNPKTGVFFDEYTTESLVKTLKNFKPESYNADNCKKQAKNFASEIFIYKLQNYIKDALQSN